MEFRGPRQVEGKSKMSHGRRLYDQPMVECPQGDISLAECTECPFYEGIKRRMVYCIYRGKGDGE